jgi:hypothetical protein
MRRSSGGGEREMTWTCSHNFVGGIGAASGLLGAFCLLMFAEFVG